MYEKNLSSDLRLRLSSVDMDFLRKLSVQRCVTVSEVIRSIIGEYRRSLDTVEALKNALEFVKTNQEGKLSNGDTKTDINDQL